MNDQGRGEDASQPSPDEFQKILAEMRRRGIVPRVKKELARIRSRQYAGHTRNRRSV